jgi:hypothetical protein
MGYDVHITRKAKSWADEEDAAAISLAEWKAYIADDPEMRLADQTEVSLHNPDVALPALPTTVANRCMWLGYSKNGRGGHYAWFAHEVDRVTVKNPDEEILGKMLAIAQALQGRVQGEDGAYFDEAPAYVPDIHADTIFEASTDFRDFQTFASAEAAQPLLAMLARQGFVVRTAADNGQVAFDPSFANNQLTSEFIVKLRLADFERASQLLADMNQDAINQADPSHYLFTFTDEELFDLLVKPDEWSGFDVALADQLLRQRGRDVSPDTLRLLRQHRAAELARPDKDHKSWILAGYLSALLGGFFGLLIGYQLYFHRKLLPDGRRVYAYSATDRVHGLRILVLASIMLVLLVGVRVMQSTQDS